MSEFDLLKQAQEEKKRTSSVLFTKSAYNPAIKACVGGSAAEAERVWSMAGHVLTQQCSSMSPLVFELIMYLKYNSRLWGLVDVIEANKLRKLDRQPRIAIVSRKQDWRRRRQMCIFGTK
jgi:hypothetical protein